MDNYRGDCWCSSVDDLNMHWTEAFQEKGMNLCETRNDVVEHVKYSSDISCEPLCSKNII